MDLHMRRCSAAPLKGKASLNWKLAVASFCRKPPDVWAASFYTMSTVARNC